MNAGQHPDAPAPLVDELALQAAHGAVEVQQLVEHIQSGRLGPEYAWSLLVELAARYGWKSAACRSAVIELATGIEPRHRPNARQVQAGSTK